MNNDLIGRQAAVDAIDKIFPADPMRNDYTEGITCGAALAKEYIKQLASAQPERKCGAWVLDDGTQVHRDLKPGESAYCNQCGETAPGYPFWECDLELTNFCPHCGAEMERV